MATTQTRGLTKSQVAKLSNDELLKTFDLIADDVLRRIRNYFDRDDARAIMDGVRFADLAQRTASDLMFGEWPYHLDNVTMRLGKQLGSATIIEEADDA